MRYHFPSFVENAILFQVLCIVTGSGILFGSVSRHCDRKSILLSLMSYSRTSPARDHGDQSSTVFYCITGTEVEVVSVDDDFLSTCDISDWEHVPAIPEV
ncbi:uncharacterized protein BP01DRAFT_173219 [Aspergillus saccharolyticus JOP 1030-1]|uniref:Uncharacterized protein n=1 Tax=Aspergillus saccharolyticus JOP 1030-1 TaxID=1450539 RepID=A0A318Z4G8_9EURO|nr:hypothetical protein BP01DRAFT_173219 [Aspergillus saccharolyticus JOP 1030-1]PYH41314.1 hypothetical protein BP01DRAFT_173219 [Aspergillus saccharolyticus JOP 1030-1]